ncbi:MAG: S46 family peptidase [Cyclobacteriaceae bacterium]
MYRTITAFIFCLIISSTARADEGMWLPIHIKNLLLYENMQELGLKLSAEEIYSVNQSSLKDAIVSLGGFCTGEVISDQGLLLTNHHCAYDAIQSHSTVENDLLENGFFAKSRADELPNEGLYVRFLVRMEDVTEQFNKVLSDTLTAEERQAFISQMTQEVEKQASEATGYEASVKSFFAGNEFYLFLYETYRDIRLVGAPPESIGKFGGDTDNWMWPRHTGDFSMFRIYTGPDGKPAEYSEDNIPLKPRHHLPISLEGVEEGDFAMVFGFPGSTDRYLTSYGVQFALDITNPTRVKIRDKRLSILKKDMDADEALRIKYASKYAQVSNYWKYFIGQSQGLKNLNIVEKKQSIEQDFRDWTAQQPQQRSQYDTVLSVMEKSYDQLRKYQESYLYLSEAVFGTEILPFAYQFSRLSSVLENESASPEESQAVVATLREATEEHFKDYSASTDQKVFAALLEMYAQDVPADQLPAIFERVQKKYKSNYSKWAAQVYENSVYSSQEETKAFLDDPSLKVLEKDPAYQAMESFMDNYFEQIAPMLRSTYGDLESNNRLFVAGLREMNPDQQYYPDANSTLRLTYGSVQSYEPKDGVLFQHLTTLEGVAEKRDPNNMEFEVPDKLMELYQTKDYGPYGMDGEMPVCFITNNDITGGNSGSPVINAQGQLIGTAFDGNWEAMSGDIAFEDELQRCINVDIRYTLFIIDKFAGANHLIEEMTIVEPQEEPELEPESVTEETEEER